MLAGEIEQRAGTDPRHQAISSRLVKEIAALGGDVTKFVGPRINDALISKVRA